MSRQAPGTNRRFRTSLYRALLLTGVLSLAVSFLPSCSREPLLPQEKGDETVTDGPILLTKGAIEINDVEEFDTGKDNFFAFRAFLLNLDRPCDEYAAEGTYCNIYEHADAGDGLRWYHPIHCDSTGRAAVDFLTKSRTEIQTETVEEEQVMVEVEVIYEDIPEDITPYLIDTHAWTGNAESGYIATTGMGKAAEFTPRDEDGHRLTWGNSKYGLWAEDNTYALDFSPYRLLLVHPAKMMDYYVRYMEEGEDILDQHPVFEKKLASDKDVKANRRYGIRQGRKERVLVSQASTVTLMGTYLADEDGRRKYVYSYNNDKEAFSLIDHRSTLSVSLNVGEELDHVDVAMVTLSNYITEGLFFPINEDTDNSHGWRDVTLEPRSNLGIPQENRAYLQQDEYGIDSCFVFVPQTLTYKDGRGNVNPDVPAIDRFFLMSQDYREKDPWGKDDAPLHDIPYLNVFIKSSTGDLLNVPVPLRYNFEPQVHYTMKIIVNSWSLYLYLKGTQWDEKTDMDIDFGAVDPIEIFLDSPIGEDNWENGGDMKGEIG